MAKGFLQTGEEAEALFLRRHPGVLLGFSSEPSTHSTPRAALQVGTLKLPEKADTALGPHVRKWAGRAHGCSASAATEASTF